MASAKRTSGLATTHRVRPLGSSTYLPDFCAIPVIFSVVIIGELLAFVLVLSLIHI